MIVVDANVILSLILPGERRTHAMATLSKDAGWAAPMLWRLEVANVLLRFVRHREMDGMMAGELLQWGLRRIGAHQYEPDVEQTLRLAIASNCTVYDCQYVALAQALACPLVTEDRQILQAFPETAVDMAGFLAS